MKIALPRMLARGSGHIVNLASAAGRTAWLPGEATYVATKHAVVGVSEAVRCELEGTAVGVTTVLPNLANTRLGSGMHAARGMKKLDAADIADAIVDGLRHRHAEVYVPPSLRQLSVLDLALPRRLKRVVHRASAAIRSQQTPTVRGARRTRRRQGARCTSPSAGASPPETQARRFADPTMKMRTPPTALSDARRKTSRSAGQTSPSPRGERSLAPR